MTCITCSSVCVICLLVKCNRLWHWKMIKKAVFMKLFKKKMGVYTMIKNLENIINLTMFYSNNKRKKMIKILLKICTTDCQLVGKFNQIQYCK